MSLKGIAKDAVGIVSGVTGTAPIASSGGTAPAISIDPLFTLPRVAAGGTVDAITANYVPDLTLADGVVCAFISAGANTSTTPTFQPDGLTAHTITARGGQALAAGDIGPAGFVAIVEYNLASTRWELLNPKDPKPATQQVFLSGSAATYTTPAGVRQIKVRMKGGGGGGGGSGSTDPTNATAGGTTSFNSITAVGGSLGADGSLSGTPGGTGGSGTAFRIPGAAGGAPAVTFATATTAQVIGGNGGGAGGGASTIGAVTGNAGVANSGGGGAGGGIAATLFGTLPADFQGSGGGEGEYAEFIITSPAANYTYTVGGAGSGGGAGTGGAAGGAGGSGFIVVDEFY